MDPLEGVAVLLSVAGVVGTAARRLWCWPVGLASVLLYAWIFLGARLYSDAALQVFYAGMNVYGWYHWRRNPVAARKPAVRSPARGTLLLGLLAGAAGGCLLGAFMAGATDAALPWIDAGLTAYSLVAQFWMARLYRANWLLWIAVDVVYVGVYVVRGLHLTAALYAGFIVIAALGWRAWVPRTSTAVAA